MPEPKENPLIREVKYKAWAMQEPIPDKYNHPFDAGTSYRRGQRSDFDRAVAQAIDAGVMSSEDAKQTLLDAQKAWGEWRRIQNDFFASAHKAPRSSRSSKQS